MDTFQYTITKFDEQTKSLVVTFDDGGWAEIRLIKPLPKTKEDLENIIKQFTTPLEAVQAQLEPDTDLTYINALVGTTFEANRFSLKENDTINGEKTTDLSAMQMWEQVRFEKKLGEALVKFGLCESNPATIPVQKL